MLLKALLTRATAPGIKRKPRSVGLYTCVKDVFPIGTESMLVITQGADKKFYTHGASIQFKLPGRKPRGFILPPSIPNCVIDWARPRCEYGHMPRLSSTTRNKVQRIIGLRGWQPVWPRYPHDSDNLLMFDKFDCRYLWNEDFQIWVFIQRVFQK